MLKRARHYIEYFVVIYIATLSRFLGFALSSNIFGVIARTIGPWIAVSNVARKNIKRAFPALSKAEIEEIVRDSWENLGRTAVELPNLFRLNSETFYHRVKVSGIEHLNKLAKLDQPSIVITAHQGNWELAVKVGVDAGLRLAIIYRKANNNLVNKIIQKMRHQDILLIPKGREGARHIVQAFKEKRCICILADQKLNSGGIEVPFFDHLVMTPTAPAKLALDYKCPIVPLHVVRNKGTYFEVIVEPPIQINYQEDNSKEIYRIMCEINYIYERWIRAHPGQWFWLHKRWAKDLY